MRRAFTLLELLIVVAIIAVLAAIAVPNFLDARTRARVSSAVSAQRTMAMALEAYRADQNLYPPAENAFIHQSAKTQTWRLSTPIAFVAMVPPDIFFKEQSFGMPGGPFGPGGKYMHVIADRTAEEAWVMWSYGPDEVMEFQQIVYDPTNGTISAGDIYRVGAVP